MTGVQTCALPIFTGERRKGYDQLEELYEYAKQYITNSDLFTQEQKTAYGLSKLEEFASEVMTNPEFQAMLRTIRYKASGYSIYSRFMHGVRMLLGLTPKEGESNVFAEAMQATDMIMPVPKLEKSNVDTGYLNYQTKQERLDKSVEEALTKRDEQIGRAHV